MPLRVRDLQSDRLALFFPVQVADLSMGDLLLHTNVIWLNPPASLGKWKKEPQLAAFGTSVVCLTATWQVLASHIDN